eukprot:scaffold6307_cov109-Skeletonema_dohrnii-CCMP3373.AAC.6
MSQAADADDAKNDIAAAVDDSYDDLCEVEIPFSMIDDGSSDDDNLEQDPASNSNVSHTEKLNENAALDCFNFSVTAHIKGRFEHTATINDDTKIPSEENKGKDIGKSKDDKEGAIEQNPTISTKPNPDNDDCEKGWSPASLPLPSWAASD